MFRDVHKRHKANAGIEIRFSEELAHKIEAGADIFLIPSRYEPCGLNQMYSLKYATVPVVSAVGGLDDTIEEFDPRTRKGNGVKFNKAGKEPLLGALRRAISVYRKGPLWNVLMQNCLGYDFSWHASAGKYKELYQRILSAV